jgi:hypothetical protein
MPRTKDSRVPADANMEKQHMHQTQLAGHYVTIPVGADPVGHHSPGGGVCLIPPETINRDIKIIRYNGKLSLRGEVYRKGEDRYRDGHWDNSQYAQGKQTFEMG